MMTNEAVLSTVKDAFRPLRCGAEIFDYQAKLRFRVFDESDRALVGYPKLVLDDLRSRTRLSIVIEAARQRLEARGYVLDPWDFSLAGK